MAAGTSASAPPDLRREQMLRAAAELIGERGFSETRIADVARRAGASPALVIYYFATKDQLLTEALRFSEDGVLPHGRPPSSSTLRTARERLELLVRTTCVPQGEGEVPGAWGLWFDLWAQAFRHPEIAKDRIELDQRWRDTIAQVVRDGQASRRDRRCRRRRVRDHLLGADRRAVDPGRAAGPGRRPGPGVRDRDGLRGPRAGRRVAAAARLAEAAASGRSRRR